MFSTVIFAVLFFGILFVSLALWALALRLGLRWAKAEMVTTRRVVATTLAVNVFVCCVNALFLLPSPSTDMQAVLLALVQLVVAIVMSCLVIGTVFKIRFWRAFQAWLPTLLATAATLAIVAFALRPFIYEAFVVPTNSMAPTILGDHWRGTCSTCGERNYCSPRDARYDGVMALEMICENFHITEATGVDRTIHSCDRFLVAKFLTPQRWDLIVFQFPEDPATLYVKRLVGLPGEKVHIQDGFVWTNDIKQQPPSSVSGIQYLSDVSNWRGAEAWGTLDHPAQLGEDEYFVLGDFSSQALDSRFWQRGAPGFQPFAVPESYIKGVVTHTFWPIARWRTHR